MIIIAITGGIGSGKTFVSNLLKERGIPIYNTDDEAKRLMLSDMEIRRDLIALLGREVYQDGSLNKPLLASYLFADVRNTAQINRIVHPRVKADFIRWMETYRNYEIVGMECAILFEAGFEDVVDSVVMVYAPESLRVERAMIRDHATESQIRARIAAQMNDEVKCKRSDFVIYTDGRFSINDQLTTLLEQIKHKKM